MKVYQMLLIGASIVAFSACGVKNDSKNSAPLPKKNITIPVSSLATNSDLVCGMTLKQGDVGDTAMYQGKVYGFCGTGCKDEFLKTPNQYLTQQ
jgi:YHS domain-containing protein